MHHVPIGIGLKPVVVPGIGQEGLREIPRSSVWLEEMTWLDVRDALANGATTTTIPTGGIEPNGPWLVTGKHNYVLRTNCAAIARDLRNAICAPVMELVPEGRIDLRAVRRSERVATGQAVIDGVSLANLGQSLHWAQQVADARANRTAAVIRKHVSQSTP